LRLGQHGLAPTAIERASPLNTLFDMRMVVHLASLLILLVGVQGAKLWSNLKAGAELQPVPTVSNVPIKQIAKQIQSLLESSSMNSPGSAAAAQEISDMGAKLLGDVEGRYKEVQNTMSSTTQFDHCASVLNAELAEAEAKKKSFEPEKDKFNVCLGQVELDVDKWHACRDEVPPLQLVENNFCDEASGLDLSMPKALQKECELMVSGWWGNNLEYWERFETKRAELNEAEIQCKEAQANLSAKIAECDALRLLADKVRTVCHDDFQPLAFCSPWLEMKSAIDSYSSCWTWAEDHFNKSLQSARTLEPLLSEQFQELKQWGCLADLLKFAHAVSPTESEMYELGHTLQYCDSTNEIKGRSECRNAAAALGMVWKGKTKLKNGHKGCYYQRDGRKVWFNTKGRSSPTDSRYASLCLKSNFPNPYDKNRPSNTMTSGYQKVVQQKIQKCADNNYDLSSVLFSFPTLPSKLQPTLDPVPTGTANCRVAFEGSWTNLGLESRCGVGGRNKQGMKTLETCKYACEADTSCKGIEFASGGHCVLYDETPSEQSIDVHSKGYTCVRYDG